MEEQYEKLKSKLHDSFKEYLQILETVKRLEVEAEKGSEQVRQKNEILSRNLDKLSKDFEVASKDLITSTQRIKELEFELDEITIQFNECGEAKRNLDAEKIKLQAELAAKIIGMGY
jgi:uncharacterized protein (DUF3084 family)